VLYLCSGISGGLFKITLAALGSALMIFFFAYAVKLNTAAKLGKNFRYDRGMFRKPKFDLGLHLLAKLKCSQHFDIFT